VVIGSHAYLMQWPTMGIAKEAGVADGSLFTYFETKRSFSINSIAS
jgi:hypothetical protein